MSGWCGDEWGMGGVTPYLTGDQPGRSVSRCDALFFLGTNSGTKKGERVVPTHNGEMCGSAVARRRRMRLRSPQDTTSRRADALPDRGAACSSLLRNGSSLYAMSKSGPCSVSWQTSTVMVDRPTEASRYISHGLSRLPVVVSVRLAQ